MKSRKARSQIAETIVLARPFSYLRTYFERVVGYRASSDVDPWLFLPTFGEHEIIACVRVQPIATAAEALGVKILRRTLSGTSWIIAPRVSIQSVLTKEEGLSEAAFSLFTRGHFDCVVCREDDSRPVFAVEFDGAGHNMPRQAARDRLKNLFCMAAGLPLLRLGTAELIARERVSVLEWLTQALVSEFDQVEGEDATEGNDLADGFDTPSEVDVGFGLDEDGAAFESEHPFPANAAITERLLQQYNISVGSPLTQPSALPRIEMDSSSGTSRYVLNVQWPGRRTFEEGPASQFVVSECDFSVHDRRTLLREGVGRGRFAWAHRLPDRPELNALVANEFLSADQIEYRLERRLSPVDLGWWEASGVARELAHYDALSQVERWAQHGSPTPIA